MENQNLSELRSQLQKAIEVFDDIKRQTETPLSALLWQKKYIRAINRVIRKSEAKGAQA